MENDKAAQSEELETADVSEKGMTASFHEVREYQVDWNANGVRVIIFAGVTKQPVQLNISSAAELTAALIMLGRDNVAYDFNTGTLSLPRRHIGR